MGSRLVLASCAALAVVAAPRVTAQPARVVRATATVPVVDLSRSADATFLTKAAEGSALDAELARLALARAHTAPVKVYARKVLDARVAIDTELASFAKARRLGLPPRAATAPPPAVVDLSARTAQDFDAAFVAAMIARHDATIALFDAESRDGRDDELQEFAARQLPALRDHLAAARALRSRART